MPYTESYPHFESILRYALRQSKEIMQEPAPEIGIELFDTYTIKVAVRPFVRPENYWAAKFEDILGVPGVCLLATFWLYLWQKSVP